ncbi:MAG: AAA family ATPase [Chitinophagaceae bacterium]
MQTIRNKRQTMFTKQVIGGKNSPGDAHGLFIVNKANADIENAKNIRNPKMLFSEFWHESELCVLYGEAGTGKSALAVQIANSITRGRPVREFKMTAKSQRVLYCDFELSDKQFENRYSNDFKKHYRFHNNLYRLSLLQDAVLPKKHNICSICHSFIGATYHK